MPAPDGHELAWEREALGQGVTDMGLGYSLGPGARRGARMAVRWEKRARE